MLEKKIYKSNKSIYFQISFQKKILISLKGKKKTFKKNLLGSEALLCLYKKKGLKFSSLSFFFKGYSKENNKIEKEISQKATEYAIESGLFK